MVSSSKLAAMKIEAKKQILKALEELGADIPPIIPHRNMKHLGELPLLHQIRDSLWSFDGIKPIVETPVIEPPPVVEEPIVPEVDIPDVSKMNKKDALEVLEMELSDMGHGELVLYANSLGVTFPKNIKDDTLIKKILNYVKVTSKG